MLGLPVFTLEQRDINDKGDELIDSGNSVVVDPFFLSLGE